MDKQIFRVRRPTYRPRARLPPRRRHDPGSPAEESCLAFPATFSGVSAGRAATLSEVRLLPVASYYLIRSSMCYDRCKDMTLISISLLAVFF
jgi:hypothetical protein